MLSRSDKIKQLVQQVLAGRHWYFDLDTCPIEEREAVQKKILEVDGKLADLCHFLYSEQDTDSVHESTDPALTVRGGKHG